MPAYGAIAKIVVNAVGKAAQSAGKLIREMPKPRIQEAANKIKPESVIPQAAKGIPKESKTIGASAINHYDDILKQLPDGPAKDKLLASLDKEAWAKTTLSQREKLDKAIQEFINQKVDIKRGMNSRGITEISQIKPYGYWTVKSPEGEIKFGFSYPALLHLSEKLTPIQKSRFLSSLEEALRLPLKPGSSSKIADSIKLTFNEPKNGKELSIKIGDLKLEGFQWDDGIYTIDTIY